MPNYEFHVEFEWVQTTIRLLCGMIGKRKNKNNILRGVFTKHSIVVAIEAPRAFAWW
jgi:hypothetical protein